MTSADAADHADAATLAEEAGQLLLEIRHGLERGMDPWDVKDAGDYQSHRLLMRRLAELHPDDGILSEEGADNLARLERERVWIVDPLDGTREFGEFGRPDWAVHVALVINGEPAAGAVALPAQGLVLSTGDPPPTPPPRPGADTGNVPLRMVVSRTRPPHAASHIASVLGAQFLPMGSAGAKAMAVVRGDADIYAHAGGQYEWDSAAPVAVARAAGLHASRLSGRPLVYNEPDPWLPDLLICRPELVEHVLAALR